MTVPSFFIVGAPRCGTSSLYMYLAAHPGVFLSTPKEPHHFGADLPIRWRPFADRDRYLQLFQAAGDRRAGEASVMYLYSKTAPAEIQELSPAARIIIMLRDPAELVASIHAHNLVLGYEVLTDLQQALEAEEDRRRGRRIPPACIAPVALHYTYLATYTDNVLRYLEAFGPDRVRCILLKDLIERPQEVYRDTLAFLALDSAGSVEFKRYNERHRWRSQGAARLIWTAIRRGQLLGGSLRSDRLRTRALRVLDVATRLSLRAGLVRADPEPMPRALREGLARRFRPDVARLSDVLGRDLSEWLRG